MTRFAVEGWNPAKPAPLGTENVDVWVDLDSGNNVQTRYLRGDALDQVFARIASDGSAYWLLTDRLRSLRDVTDNTGVVKDTIAYDGFGNITSETDSSFRGRYSWTGRELDTETSFQFHRARYYDPKIGRWISQDPFGFDVGDSNLYRYVHNSATNATDRSGNIVWFIPLIIIGGGLLIGGAGAVVGANNGPPGTVERFIPIWGAGRSFGANLAAGNNGAAD